MCDVYLNYHFFLAPLTDVPVGDYKKTFPLFLNRHSLRRFVKSVPLKFNLFALNCFLFLCVQVYKRRPTSLTRTLSARSERSTASSVPRPLDRGPHPLDRARSLQVGRRVQLRGAAGAVGLHATVPRNNGKIGVKLESIDRVNSDTRQSVTTTDTNTGGSLLVTFPTHPQLLDHIF